jgi:hypothetical protein
MRQVIRSVLVVLALAGCGGGPHLEPGDWAVVTELTYDDPDAVSVCVSYNSNGGCNVHVPVVSAERFIVEVRGTGDNAEIDDSFEVSSAEWREYEIGDEVRMP